MKPHSRRARGLFITLEGVDGVGKTSQLQRLAEHLATRGHDVVVTHEPGGTPLGTAIDGWLKDHRAGAMVARAEALLFLAARAQHVEEVIKPALAAGRTVLCSRYSHSTLAYQCYGLGLDEVAVRAADEWARDGLWPDVVLLLEAAGETVAKRRGERCPEDRIETRGEVFWERVSEGFRALARAEPERVRTIPAEAGPEAVQEALREAVEPWL